MPRKIKDVTKDYLVNVTLPTHGQSYTVISHQSIIDYAYQELANQGFGIADEEYRSTLDGQIAQGIYRLQFGTDPEMSLMFAWTNSYNKQIRFKCATGGYVNANQTVMLAGELGTYARKHTGTADADVIASMQVQITNARMYYNQLVNDKEVMKTIPLSSRKQAELLGILFAEYEILTTEQASIIRQQMDKPSFFYNGGKDTLWAFYNHVTVALQQSHPRTWMEDQRMLHWVISNEFDLSTTTPDITPVDPLYEVPNQTNILDQITEVQAHEIEGFVMDDVIEELREDLSELEVVNFTDPAGNTFEAPIVTNDLKLPTVPCAAHDVETEKEEAREPEVAPARVKFAIDLDQEEEVVSLEPTPEDHEAFEAEQAMHIDTVNLNENTKITVEVVETEQDDDDFGFSFDLNEESTDNDLFL